MTDETVDIKKLANQYVWQVQDVDKALTRLAQDADELTREVQEHEQARKASQEQRDVLERQRASLQGERNSLMGQHAEATFTSDTAELQRISRRRVALDKELEEVNENIRECVGKHEEPDHQHRAAELSVTKSELEKRLPKKTFEMALNNPILESISKTLQDDADRLRKMHTAITLPAAPEEALQEARQQRGLQKGVDPAFLRQQAREKEARRNRINANRNAVLGAEAAHTGGEIREYDEDGRLTGDAIREALQTKSA